MPEQPVTVQPRLDWPSGRPVLVACSGGADSLALLHLLKDGPWVLRAAHLDHAGRPDSHEQALAVERVCREWNIPCQTRRLQVARWAARYGMSWEAAGRMLRYRWLAAVAAEDGALLVTGHTADDQAETVVMRAIQGTTLVGLASIMPSAEGLARPLLHVRRAELQAYLSGRGIPWFEDPGNRDSRFLRVRVRREVLPLLQALNPRAVAHLAQLAEDALELRQWVRSQPPGQLARTVFDDWLHDRWVQQNPPLSARWSREHAARIYAAVQEGQPGIWNLPGGMWAEWDGARLWLGPLRTSLPELSRSEGSGPEGASAHTVVLRPEFCAQLTWRFRQPGDLWGSRPLKKVFHDWGVPRSLRDRLPLLVQGADRVLWVPGWGLRPEAAWTQADAGGVRFSVSERSGWGRPEAARQDDEPSSD